MNEAQTILLLEDKPTDRDIIQKKLKSSLENPIVVVENDRKVRDYLQGTGEFSDRQAHPFPLLLLLDLQMPDKNGFDLLEWCKNHRKKEIKSLPIAVIAELKDIGTVNRAYALGADTFFARPFNIAEFENWIIHFNWLQMNNRCIIPAVGSGA
jgi:CheY-like chemotaxis protein